MKRAAIITASDSGYRGEREDLSGPAIREILEREGYEVISMDILPDDQVMLAGKLQEIADSEKAELILKVQELENASADASTDDTENNGNGTDGATENHSENEADNKDTNKASNHK